MLNCFGGFIFYEAHWLFSWRYWEVSEFLASQNGRKVIGKNGMLAINIMVTLLILADESCAFYVYNPNFEGASIYGPYL